MTDKQFTNDYSKNYNIIPTKTKYLCVTYKKIKQIIYLIHSGNNVCCSLQKP